MRTGRLRPFDLHGVFEAERRDAGLQLLALEVS
jgi:hypothetical protein